MTIKTYGLALKSRKTPIADLVISRILADIKHRGDECTRNNAPKYEVKSLGSASKEKDAIINIELKALAADEYDITPVEHIGVYDGDIPHDEYVGKPFKALMIGERLNFLLYSSK